MKTKHYSELGSFLQPGDVVPYKKRLNTIDSNGSWVQVLDIQSEEAGSCALMSINSKFNSAASHNIFCLIATSYNSHTFNLLGSTSQDVAKKVITKLRFEKAVQIERTWKVFAYIAMRTDYLEINISHQYGVSIPTTNTNINSNAFFIKEYDL